MQMVRQVGLHLISKLRYNSALYLPYDGPYWGRGPRRKYGKKVDYHHIPSTYLQSISMDKEIKTKYTRCLSGIRSLPRCLLLSSSSKQICKPTRPLMWCFSVVT